MAKSTLSFEGIFGDIQIRASLLRFWAQLRTINYTLPCCLCNLGGNAVDGLQDKQSVDLFFSGPLNPRVLETDALFFPAPKTKRVSF